VSDYWIEVFLLNVECRDTESIHSSDMFALSGAISTDHDAQGFVMPTVRINTGETRSYLPAGPIFAGGSNEPKVGLALEAWDIDENDSWVENEDDVGKAISSISGAAKLVPGWGTTAAAVIQAIGTAARAVINFFVGLDKNDPLLEHRTWVDLPVGGMWETIEVPHAVIFKGSDATGYSSWDYTLNFAIRCTPTPSLFAPKNPFWDADAQSAMAQFRHRALVASDEGQPGAFPNFFAAQYGANYVGGTIFVHGSRGAGNGWTTIAEWRDVALAELANVDLNDFWGRFKATQDYAVKQGFVGGFPNFYHADYGNGVVCGTILLKPTAAEWRDVPIGELDNPSLDSIAERFRGTQSYAQRNGFVGGFPNFYHADYGNGVVCGTVLVKPSAAHWRDVVLRRDPG
jgi:hypothetical protein